MAINKEIRSNVGMVAAYHRIQNVVFDFDQGMVHIMVSSYADESYRQQEKDEFSRIRTQIKRYYELADKKELSEEEWLEFGALNISELEAYKIEPTVMGVQKYSFAFSEDVRPGLYKQLTEIIPELKNGKAV